MTQEFAASMMDNAQRESTTLTAEQHESRSTVTLRVEGITKVYKTGGMRVEALRGVDLDFVLR